MVACSGELDPSLVEFEVGDCIRDTDFFVGVEELESLDRVDCSEPGVLRSMRVFDIIQYDDYPAEATIESLASSRCPFDSPLTSFQHVTLGTRLMTGRLSVSNENRLASRTAVTYSTLSACAPSPARPAKPTL